MWKRKRRRRKPAWLTHPPHCTRYRRACFCCFRRVSLGRGGGVAAEGLGCRYFGVQCGVLYVLMSSQTDRCGSGYGGAVRATWQIRPSWSFGWCAWKVEVGSCIENVLFSEQRIVQHHCHNTPGRRIFIRFHLWMGGRHLRFVRSRCRRILHISFRGVEEYRWMWCVFWGGWLIFFIEG